MKTKLFSIADIITSEETFSERTTKLLAILFLVVAALLCFGNYSGTRFYFLPDGYTIKPTLISATAALAMLVPLYARNILRWSKSIYGLIVFVLLWTVYAGIVSIALNGKSNIPEYLVAAAALLSWLGIRGVAGFAWILAFAACIYSIINTSDHMSHWGYIFVVCTFLGCVFHSGLSPADFVRDVREEFDASTKAARQRIGGDVASAGQMGKRVL